MTAPTLLYLYAVGFFAYGAFHLSHYPDPDEDAWVVVIAVAFVSLAWPWFLAYDVAHWWKDRKP